MVICSKRTIHVMQQANFEWTSTNFTNIFKRLGKNYAMSFQIGDQSHSEDVHYTHYFTLYFDFFKISSQKVAFSSRLYMSLQLKVILKIETNLPMVPYSNWRFGKSALEAGCMHALYWFLVKYCNTTKCANQ